MMMHSSSFESPKPYLFGYYLKNSIIALLRYVILAQSTPILLHTEGFVSFVSLSTVSKTTVSNLVTFSFQRDLALWSRVLVSGSKERRKKRMIKTLK